MAIAFAINKLGQVVGSYYTATDAQYAFLYSGGQMQNLTSLLPPKLRLDIARGRQHQVGIVPIVVSCSSGFRKSLDAIELCRSTFAG